YLDSDLTVINIVNIEEYLYGVVPQEIEASAPMEAIKAQAVAARTYTYRNLGKYSKWGFDLVDTASDQVYNGYDGEKQATNAAVDQTRGKKILYEGSPISVHYFSSSGGMTEDSANVWGTSLPYLKSVPDPYESGTSYNYTWTKTFTAQELKQILFLSDVDIGDILSVSIEEVSEAGRPIKLKFTGTKGSITYYRQDGRAVLGLPSNNYTISSPGSTPAPASGTSGTSGTVYAVTADGSKRGVDLENSVAVTSSGTRTLSDSGTLSAISSGGISTLSSGSRVSSGSTATVTGNVYVFTGKGWGHGVGMSQEGAKGFALQGYTYEQILKHYFTGVTIE
ncbi:MAG TPA: SpoIID/LytB domain-containing protein, partial [Thermoclostridium caenicola]|nr:SpoIID/LytB domain-containing protein [Thermoclostridium caenicola]